MNSWHGARNTKKGRRHRSQGNRIKHGFIRGQRKACPVTVLCRMMEASAFYAWLKRPVNTEKAQQKAALEAKAGQPFDSHKQIYGYRRLSNELGKAGIKSGHYQVRHLMARLGLKARYPTRFKITTGSNHNGAISPNSLGRKFDAVAPSRVWATDINYIWTLAGWLYLAVAIDLFTRHVVGWAVADHMKTALCASALQMAFWRRKPKPGLLHHGPGQPICQP